MDAAEAQGKTAPFDLGDSRAQPCLLLHGFTGSPWEVRPLGEALAQAGFRAVAPRLPGHGQRPEAMLEATWRDWIREAEHRLAGLEGPVRIAALSMGCLLGLILAARQPERVRALALMAPAVRFKSWAMAVGHLLRRLPVMEIVRPWVYKDGPDIEEPSTRAQAPAVPRFPSTRLRDLWALQDEAKAATASIRAPTLILEAKGDHVIEAAGIRALERRLANARVRRVTIDQGCHIMPRDRGGPRVIAEVLDFFRQV